jgi:SAM-dependent methyltransferase
MLGYSKVWLGQLHSNTFMLLVEDEMLVLKLLAADTLGLALYSYYIGRYGFYKGQQAVYGKIQSQNSIIGKILRVYVEKPFEQSRLFIKQNWDFCKENISKDRLSAMAVEQYSDDSLSGYGDTDYNKGGGTSLEMQQRGQILADLCKSLALLNPGGCVCEIGCGNGDIIAHLAITFPKLKFIGVDFSVKNAMQKHHLANLQFIKGYALDFFERSELKANIVYASSTFCVFNPKELSAYIKLFKDAGVSSVFINEPSWGKYNFNPEEYSIHLEGAVWHHNYDKHFNSLGYHTAHLEKRPYKPNKSARPDIILNIAHYDLQTTAI